MTLFLCLYAGESFEEVELRGVTCNPEIIEDFATRLISEAPDPEEPESLPSPLRAEAIAEAS